MADESSSSTDSYRTVVKKKPLSIPPRDAQIRGYRNAPLGTTMSAYLLMKTPPRNVNRNQSTIYYGRRERDDACSGRSHERTTMDDAAKTAKRKEIEEKVAAMQLEQKKLEAGFVCRRD